MAKSKQIELTFESAMERLNEIIAEMETETTPLKKSVEIYREGAVLLEFCRSEISGAENDVKIIRIKSDGEIVAEVFDASEKDDFE